MSDHIRVRMVELLPRLRRFAFLLCGDMDTAEDITQEACVKALAHADQWNAGTRLDSWMYRIAQNIWLDRLRARKVRGCVFDLDSALDVVGEDGRQVAEGRLLLRQVVQGIGSLSTEQQILMTLICVDGLSYREAADALDVPVGTIMSRLARARVQLREAIESGADRQTAKSRCVRG